MTPEALPRLLLRSFTKSSSAWCFILALTGLWDAAFVTNRSLSLILVGLCSSRPTKDGYSSCEVFIRPALPQVLLSLSPSLLGMQKPILQ